jgi:hypothetical protein
MEGPFHPETIVSRDFASRLISSTLEWLEQHRLYPPLEAMAVVANAISTLLEADPQTPVRAALGDLDDLHEAVDCLETYQAFQPEHFDRGDINRQLLAWGQEEGAVRCR